MSTKRGPNWERDRIALLERKLDAGEDAYRVDDQTWHDLGMDEVFAPLAEGLSVAGTQVLYRRLRHPALSSSAREELETQLALLAPDSTAERWLAARFAKLPGRIGWMLPELLYGEPEALAFPRWLLTLLPLLLLGGIAVGATLWSPGWMIALAAFAASIYVHYTLDRSVGAQLSSLLYLRALLVLGRELSRTPPAGLEPVAERLAALLPPVTPIIHKTWMLGIQDPFELTTYLRVVTLVEARGFASTVEIISRERAKLQAIHALLGELDAMRSVARLRADPSYCIPELGPHASLELEQVRHPSLAEAQPNTLALGERSILLTGLNMSGKSTLLRALGVNALLAQSIWTARAARYRGPFVEVLSAIEVHDDLLAGRSYYLSEVESVGRLIRAAASERPQLFLLDETFRGTNSIERVAAASAVLLHLAAGHRVLAATHDMQMCTRTAARFDNFHFGDLVDAKGIGFDYRLRPGPCPTTNAIALLEHSGFPSEIVEAARSFLALDESEQPR